MTIVQFPNQNAAEDPDVVLDKAKGFYGSILILGYDQDGVIDARASLNLNHKDINFLIDVFKAKLINGDYCDIP